jgi:hypothetical protein
MGIRAKLIVSVFLVLIVGIGVWQFTAPIMVTVAGEKYARSITYASRGNWTLEENTAYGRVFLVFSIANLTFPQPSLPATSYGLTISIKNETITNQYVKGYSFRFLSMTAEDNYDGSNTATGPGNNMGDAVQSDIVMQMKTIGCHVLKFIVNYETVDLFTVGWMNDHDMTRSFNVTQAVS